MKFNVKRNEFLKAVTVASKFVPTSSPNPVLLDLALVLNEQGLMLYGGNGDVYLETCIPFVKDDKEVIRDYKEGSILINAKILNEIVKTIDGDEINFEIVEEGLAKLENDNNTKYSLTVTRFEEYPDCNFEENGTKIVLSAKTFQEAVNQVAFAASQKNTRVALKAVNLENNGNNLIFTATDGSRLAKKELPSDCTNLFSINIDAKTLLEASRTIENEKEIEIYATDKKVLFKYDNSKIITNLIGGDYPNVRNIIPKTFYYFLEVNANDFLNAINSVAMLTLDRENIVKVTMVEGNVVVSSKSQLSGSGEKILSLFRYSGERLEISFNYHYVIDAIKALGSQDVLISFIGEMKPFTITDKNDPSNIHLITPVRTY